MSLYTFLSLALAIFYGNCLLLAILLINNELISLEIALLILRFVYRSASSNSLHFCNAHNQSFAQEFKAYWMLKFLVPIMTLL